MGMYPAGIVIMTGSFRNVSGFEVLINPSKQPVHSFSFKYYKNFKKNLLDNVLELGRKMRKMRTLSFMSHVYV